MKLKKLLKALPEIEVRGSKEIEITGLCANSKLVAPGNLFIVKKGATHDGSHFISDAIAAGAAAILTDLYDPFLENIVQLIHPNVAEIEAHLAGIFYQYPGERLFLVGITGTNGKTTTSYLVKHLLDELGHLSGLIGTVEWIVGTHVLPSTFTTPDVITVQKLLHDMAVSGCKSATMEVSSHGLELGRVKGVAYDVAIFTNLTQDHLDFHKTMEAYADVKAKLFAGLEENKTAIVNMDSPWKARMLQECKAKVLTYGIDNEADLKADNIVLSSKGTHCTLGYRGESVSFHTSLIGRFNVYNCLAATGLGLCRGMSLSQIAKALSTFVTVSGRLERVSNKKGIDIFVDYAHTDDALRNVLETLREIKKEGRIIAVFGCGGDRDHSKRPKMGRAVEELADIAIVTSDNPRSEEPREIIAQIVQGFQAPQKAVIEVDRATAICRAVEIAQKGDIVLIAGKGHERVQIFAGQTIAFDDRRIAREAAEKF